MEALAALDLKLDAAAANDSDMRMICYLGGLETVKSEGVDADWVALPNWR